MCSVQTKLDGVEDGDEGEKFGATQEAVDAVLQLAVEIFDTVGIEFCYSLTAKGAYCVGWNGQKCTSAKILDAVAIKRAQYSAIEIR